MTNSTYLRFSAILVLLLSNLAAASAAPTRTIRTRHYSFTTDLPEAQAREVAQYMDAVYDEYAKKLASLPVKDARQSNLYIWDDEQTYHEFLAEKGINSRGSGGMFFSSSRDGSGLTTWVNGRSKSVMYHTLQHEGFHQFVHNRIGDLPPWANEGIAEYFGQGLLVDGRLITGLLPKHRLMSMRQAIEQERHFPFDEIINMDGQTWNGVVNSGDPRAGIMYTQAWTIAHFLIEADDGKYAGAFSDYLEYISRGRNPQQAFQKAFHTSNTQGFEQRWLEFLQEAKPDALSAARLRLDFLAVGLQSLHARGVKVTSLEELQKALQNRNFSITYQSHGYTETRTAQDDELFAAPGADYDAGGNGRSRGRGDPPQMVLTPNPQPDLPPIIAIEGLRLPIAIDWDKQDGKLVYEIVFG